MHGQKSKNWQNLVNNAPFLDGNTVNSVERASNYPNIKKYFGNHLF